MDSKFKQRMTGIPASALGGAKPAGVVERSAMSAKLDKIALGQEVELPLLGRVWIQPVGHTESNRIEAATFEAMAKVNLPAIPGHAWSYDCQRYARILAAAVRDPDDHKKKFGTLADWLGEDEDRAVTDDMLFAWGKIYDGVKAALDPLGVGTMTQETANAIAADFEKKNPILLLSYGAAQLATWLLSGAVQLTSSATAASPTGESSPDSSSEP